MRLGPSIAALLAWGLGGGPARGDTRVLARVRAGAEARAVVLPRVNRSWDEALVRDCEVDLAGELERYRDDVVRRVDVSREQPCVWLVRVALRDPAAARLEVRAADGVVWFGVADAVVADGEAEAPPPVPVAALFAGAPDAEERPDPLPPLVFLHGDALAAGTDPRARPPTLLRGPDWLGPSSLAAVDEERGRLVAATSRVAAGQAEFRIALHYLDMGLAREAWAYLERPEIASAGLPARDLALARARAALATGRWERAREALRAAWEAGAEDGAVAEGMALVSLGSGDPPPALAARVLAGASASPRERLLAGELLQRAGRYRESLPLLRAARETLGSDAPRELCLRLGDAWYVSGDLDRADRAWDCAPPALGVIRKTMAEMVLRDPGEWPRAVPALVGRAAHRDEAGAEALYLLGQVDATVGSMADALSEYGLIMREFPERARESDVPERFWALYADYVQALAQRRLWMRVAAVHEVNWHPLVLRAVDDPAPLLAVVDAYEELGLPEKALVVLRDVTAASEALGIDDRASLLRLARLYERTGNYEDGLATLEFLRKRPLGREEQGEAWMVEARLQVGAGNPEAAARALRRAALVPGLRDRASLALAVLEAEQGDCGRSVPFLKQFLASDKGARLAEGPEPWLALARCLTAAGDLDGAAWAAREASGRSPSIDESRYALWLAVVADGWRDPAMVEALEAEDDIWGRLAREYRAAREFDRKLREAGR